MTGIEKLFAACEKGSLDEVESLLAPRKFLIFESNRNIDVNSTNTYGSTPLHEASTVGHKDIVSLLLSKGANVNAKNTFGDTPLHYACLKGKKEVVELLLAEGADMNAANYTHKTPLAMAIRSGAKEIVALLLERRAMVNEGHTPLYIASEIGQKEIAEWLIATGVDVNAAGPLGWTPLYIASRNGKKEIVELLLAKGADVNKASDLGWTPLDEASDNGHKEIVKLLTAKGVTATTTSEEISTINLLPNALVPESGLYYCTICKHGDSAIRDGLASYAREKGVDPEMLKGLFGDIGLGSNEPTTRKTFRAGDRFDECPRHKAATGWTLEKEEITAPTQASKSEAAEAAEVLMMECPPFPGQVVCSDNQCPCANTTMPPAQGYLWIKSEVAATRKSCLRLSALQGHMAATMTSAINIDEIRARYLPLVVCKEAAIRRNLDLTVAASDYASWVQTGKVPCRVTPTATKNL